MFESLTARLSSVVTGLTRKGRLTESNMDEGLGEIRAALLEADVGFGVARDLIDRVRDKALGEQVLKSVTAGQTLVKIFHDELVELMTAEGETFRFPEGRPAVVLLLGLQGSGKTTTASKLAVHLRDKRHRKPLLVAADTQRPAAVEQLTVLGGTHDLPVFHVSGESPERIAREALDEARRTGRDTVIVDTAGRLHVDDELMEELKRVVDAVKPDTALLVCDAMTGQDAVTSAKAFADALSIDGVILSKLDGDARGGAALSVRAVTGTPVRFVGTGEKVSDLQPFHADRMANRILGMGDVVGLVERAQDVVDEQEAEAQMKRMLEDQFTLDDFLKQMQAMKRMGSLKDLMGHLPGMPAGVDPAAVDEKALDRTQAVVLSMTPDERRRPDSIDASRRRRIARGSGSSERAVSELLGKFGQMRKAMKQLKKGGLMSRLAGRFGGGLAEALPGAENVSPRPASGRTGGVDRRKSRKAERQRRRKARRRR